ncbi:ATP-grasp domain-containing protein [Thalassospira alkalitolerans]|uniref:ATP-grasp domain-containing protein n=1 Tax=Thalassospira alkalitolerans TaxID=1293890 RepID=UPI003AA7D184
MNVLLTCAGRRHYLASYFRGALSGDGRLIGADMDITAPALAACDRAHNVPAVSAPEYIDRIIEIVKEEDVKMVFSLNDLEVGLLSENRERIESETGATVFVPDFETLRICADKWETFLFSEGLGLPTIPTFLSTDDALLAVHKGITRLPMIVKPRWGSASIALSIVENKDDLEEAFAACGRAVAQSALASLGSENAVIIQQLITGTEFGVDVLFNAKCEYQGFTAKRKLGMRSGETDKAITVAPDNFVEPIERISKVLRHRGNLDCDFLEQDGQIYLLEMNPRFGGGYPFSHEAGANHVQKLINDALGKPAQEYHYQPNLTFAKCDILVSVPSPPS